MPKKSSINMQEVRRLIEDDKLSTYGAAEKLGCNQSHVVRLISKWNKAHPDNIIKKRTKSEAQKNYIKQSGTHQRSGVEHSEETKELISDRMRDIYDGPEGDAMREKIREHRQKEWEQKTDKERAEILQNLKNSNRAKMQSGEGSNFENFMAEKLQEHGYVVEQRTQRWTPGNKFHVDIAMPNNKIIIEVDGPTHWSPIYGDEELRKVQNKDNMKDAILVGNGFDVIRVQDASGSCTRARFSRVLDVVEAVEKLTTPKVHYIKP